MTTRRDFIQASTAAIGLNAILGPVGISTANVQAHPLHRVIYDTRFEESRLFAEETERLGQRVASVDGDVTRLWYDDLSLRWRAGPAAIAGMTGGDVLFCLERFAYDAGLRVVMRVERRPGAGLDQPRQAHGAPPLASKPGLRQARYPVEAANAVRRCGVHAAALGPTCLPPFVGDMPEPLVTWVIAPPAALQQA